jgi:hypothetical protein
VFSVSRVKSVCWNLSLALLFSSASAMDALCSPVLSGISQMISTCSNMRHFSHASGDVSESPNRRTFFSIVLEFFFPGLMGTSIYLEVSSSLDFSFDFFGLSNGIDGMLMEVFVCVSADEFSDFLCFPDFPPNAT